MKITFRTLYIRIKTLFTFIFEKMTLRSKPEYEKVSEENDDSIVYFNNPIRNKLI